MPFGTKPLPEPMLTHISVAIWHILGHNGINNINTYWVLLKLFWQEQDSSIKCPNWSDDGLDLICIHHVESHSFAVNLWGEGHSVLEDSSEIASYRNAVGHNINPTKIEKFTIIISTLCLHNIVATMNVSLWHDNYTVLKHLSQNGSLRQTKTKACHSHGRVNIPWYIQQVQCGAIITLSIFSNIHKRQPLARLLGWGMRCLLWIHIWLISCHNFCNYLCNILQYWTAL